MIKKNVYWSSCKVPFPLSEFNETWIFATIFFPPHNTQISNFTEIHPVGAALFHADRRTDVTKHSLFHSFANAPKNNQKVDTRRKNQ